MAVLLVGGREIGWDELSGAGVERAESSLDDGRGRVGRTQTASVFAGDVVITIENIGFGEHGVSFGCYRNPEPQRDIRASNYLGLKNNELTVLKYIRQEIDLFCMS